MYPATLSLARGVPLAMFALIRKAPALRPALPLPLTTREVSIVVLLAAPVFFIIGAVLGLNTLVVKDPSFSLFTILLAWLAVNMFSFGGDPVEVAVGLRRLWFRDPAS